MRLTQLQLKQITNRSTPTAQVSWFKRHFSLTLEYDRLGVILTENAFDSLVAKKYGIAANTTTTRPTVKLTRNAQA